MICFKRELIYVFTALLTQIVSYPGTVIEGSIQDQKQIDEIASEESTTSDLSLRSKKNKIIIQSQKNTFQNPQDYKTEYGYNFRTKTENVDIDTKSIQRKKNIRTQNNIMQSKYNPKTYLTVVETSFSNPDTNMYTNHLTPVTLTENKTKHFLTNKHGRSHKSTVYKTETANKIFERKQNNSTKNSIQQSDYLTFLITTVTSPEVISLKETTIKTKDVTKRLRQNFKTKVGSKTAIEVQSKNGYKTHNGSQKTKVGSETAIQSQSKNSNKTYNGSQESDYSDKVKSPEIGNYTSLFQIARRLANPFPAFNDPEFQNILNEYRAKVQRPQNVNRDPRQFDQQNIILKMQEYQKMARLNGASGYGPGQQNQNNPGRYNPNQNHQGFKYPRDNYPMTGPRQTPKGYRFPGKIAWHTQSGRQQGFVGRNQYGWPGRQGHNYGPDRGQPAEAKKQEWEPYKNKLEPTEPPPPVYYHDRRPGETFDFFATVPPGQPPGHDILPEAAMNFTVAIPILTTFLTRFTTILTTTTRRLRTTPARPHFDEDCDYTAYYCMKAYDTGQICARTLFNHYATFKNYCMVDFVNCMERYETWVIIHMGECFEIKLISEYVHYPYMDDYFLDQYYLNENM